MREKLATLPLAQLRELAKGQGIKNVSGLRKSELIDRLCELAEKEEQEKPGFFPKRSPAMSYDSGTSFFKPHLLRLLIRS